MHIRRGYLGWGVFLILAGAVPLAVRAGYLTDDQIGRLWTLWPLILIGIGVGLILSRTRFDFIGGIIVAATLGLMAGGLLSSGVGTLSIGRLRPGRGDGRLPDPGRDLLAGRRLGRRRDRLRQRHARRRAGRWLAGRGPGCRRHRAADRGDRDDASRSAEGR